MPCAGRVGLEAERGVRGTEDGKARKDDPGVPREVAGGQVHTSQGVATGASSLILVGAYAPSSSGTRAFSLVHISLN